jgi:hypothetical protein
VSQVSEKRGRREEKQEQEKEKEKEHRLQKHHAHLKQQEHEGGRLLGEEKMGETRRRRNINCQNNMLTLTFARSDGEADCCCCCCCCC